MSSYNLGTASGRIEIDGTAAKIGFGVAESAADAFFGVVQDKVASVRKAGQTLLAVGATGQAGFALATNAAANFEERLSAIQAVSGASESDMKKISAAALQIGKDTKFSATEAASAFEELIKAGISVDDALNGAADATANLAAAGEISLPRAAEIAAAAMNNFHLAGKDMPRIADLVAGAANASAISVDEFASSLQQVGAVANLAGLSFDDTAVAIAEMGNAGIKGSDAGTSLKTMLMNLIPQTKQQAELFEKMGLMAFSSEKALSAMAKAGIKPLGGSFMEVRQAVSDYLAETEGIPNDTAKMGKAVDAWLQNNGVMQNAFFDTSGKVKSLADIQEVLKKSTQGMSKEQQLANLQILFGADAVRGAAVMADNGAAGYNKLATAMGKVTAADVAATRMNNLKGSIEQLKGSWETLMIQIGMVFLPVVKKIVDGVASMIDFFVNMNERARNFLVTIGAVSTGLSTFLGILITGGAIVAPFVAKFLLMYTIKKAVAAARGEIVLMKTAIEAGAGPITVMSTLMGRMRIAAEVLTTRLATLATVARVTWAAITGPVGIAIGIILAVVAAVVTLYNTWEPFRQLVDATAKVIGDALKAAFQWLIDQLPTVLGWLKQIGDFFSGAWKNAVMTAKKLMLDLVNGFNGVKTGADPIAQAFNIIGQTARVVWDALKGLWEVIQNNLIPAFQKFWDDLTKSDALKALGDTITNVLWPALQNLWKTMQDSLQPAIAAFGDAWNALQPALKTIGDLIVGTVWPALQKLWEAIGPIIGVILQVVGVIVGGLILALIYVASFILGTVIPAILNFAGPVLGFLLGIIANVASFIIQYLITPLINFVSFLIGTVIPGVISFGKSLVDGVVNAFQAVGNFIGGIVNFIGGIVNKIVGFFSGMGQGVEKGVSPIGEAIGNVFRFITDVWNNVVNVAKTVGTGIVSAFQGVFSFLEPGLKVLADIFTAVWNVIYAIVSGVVNLTVAIINFSWQAILWATQQVFGAISTFLSDTWNNIVGFIQPIVQGIVDFITTTWGNIVSFVTTLFTNVWNTIVSIWNGIVAFLQPIITNIVNFVVAYFTTMWTTLTTILTNIWNFIMSVWNAIVAFLTPIIQGIVNFVTGAWNNVYNAVSGAVNRIWGTIQSIWNGIVSYLSGVVNGIVRTVSGAFQNAVNTVRSVWGGLMNAVSSGWNAVGSWFGGLGQRILSAIGNIGNILFQAGQNVINGFLDGLNSIAGNITKFFQDITNKIPKVKGPEDRDKRLLTPAGKYVMQSLLTGLESGEDDIMKFLSGLTTTIPLTMQGVLDPSVKDLLSLQPQSYISTSSPVINVAAPNVSLSPNLEARVYVGSKEIEDIVDASIDEKFEEAANVTQTGVFV